MTAVENEIITQDIKEEINTFLYLRRKWRNAGMCMETTSKIMVGATSILAFTVGVYPCNVYLGYWSGCIATVSLICLQFANYSFRESKVSTENLNVLLNKLNIQPLPELNVSVTKPSPTNTDSIKSI